MININNYLNIQDNNRTAFSFLWNTSVLDFKWKQIIRQYTLTDIFFLLERIIKNYNNIPSKVANSSTEIFLVNFMDITAPHPNPQTRPANVWSCQEFPISDQINRCKEKSDMEVKCWNTQGNFFPILQPNKELHRKNLALKLDVGIHKIIHFLFSDKK